MKPYIEHHLASISIIRFKEEIKKLYSYMEMPFSDSNWALDKLDIRLARHHTGEFTRNTIPMTLARLAELLIKNEGNIPQAHVKSEDIEISLSQLNINGSELYENEINKEIRRSSLRVDMVNKYKGIMHYIYRMVK